MDALRAQAPNATIALMAQAGRLAPLSLPLRSGAADLTLVFGSELDAGLAHDVLARGLARDPHNLAYRAAMARLKAYPPARERYNPGGTEVKP